MAKRKAKPTAPPDPAEAEAMAIIRRRLVSRDDRWGAYYFKDRGKPTQRVAQMTAPRPKLITDIKNKGGHPPFLGPEQLTAHLRHEGFPVGVLSISTDDTCRWVAWDIDRHDDDIPAEAPKAAMNAIQRFVGPKLGLVCVIENSGRGGSHVWVPLAVPVRAPEAYMVAQAIKRIGEEGWAEHDFDPHVEGFPKSDSHDSSPKACGGGWLRLPGQHHKREHVSSIYAGNKRWIKGLEIWRAFEVAAKRNTLKKWREAVAVVRRMEEKRRAEAASKRRTKAKSKVAEAAAAVERKYAGWSVERLVTTPLRRSERRRREVVLVRAVLRERGSLDDAEVAVGRLYDEAAGNSRDLADVVRSAELFDETPDMVRRIAGREVYVWADPEEAERVRRVFIAAAERRERKGLRGWCAKRFARWLDGFYAFLRAQAELGGYAFLARTVVRSRVKRDGTGNNGYALERCGGMYNKVELRGPPCRQNGRRFVSEEVAPYLGYMRMLAVTPVDERLPIRIVRPAVKGLLPWLLDCSGLPLDEPGDGDGA